MKYKYKDFEIKVSKIKGEISLLDNNKNKLAYMLIEENDKGIILNNIKVIKDDNKNKGYGKILIHFLQLKNKYISLVVLYDLVRPFYEKMGFFINGDRDSYGYDPTKIKNSYSKKLKDFKKDLKKDSQYESSYNYLEM